MSTADPEMFRPGPFTMVPKGYLRDMPRAARAALEDCLWEASGRAAGIADVTDREIAAAIGCSIRTAQRAVHQLCNLMVRCVDGIVRPLMERWFQHGNRRECGRRMQILAPEVIPVEKEKDKDADAERIAAAFDAAVHRRPKDPKGEGKPRRGTNGADAPKPPKEPPPTPDQEQAIRSSGLWLGAYLAMGAQGDPEEFKAAHPTAAAAFARWREQGPRGSTFRAWWGAHPEAGLSDLPEPKPRK